MQAFASKTSNFFLIFLSKSGRGLSKAYGILPGLDYLGRDDETSIIKFFGRLPPCVFTLLSSLTSVKTFDGLNSLAFPSFSTRLHSPRWIVWAGLISWRLPGEYRKLDWLNVSKLRGWLSASRGLFLFSSVALVFLCLMYLFLFLKKSLDIGELGNLLLILSKNSLSFVFFCLSGSKCLFLLFYFSLKTLEFLKSDKVSRVWAVLCFRHYSDDKF